MNNNHDIDPRWGDGDRPWPRDYVEREIIETEDKLRDLEADWDIASGMLAIAEAVDDFSGITTYNIQLDLLDARKSELAGKLANLERELS